MSKEIWKPIKCYEGLYEVSNLGRVRSSKFNGRMRTLSKDKDGYHWLGLWKNNKCSNFRVGRLVAEAFIPNPNNLPQVNHINEIKNDDRVENLEWCTEQYNVNYGSRMDNIRRKVAQFSMEGELIKIWDSISEAGDFYGVNTNIINTCRGNRNHAYGFKWRYVNDRI